MRVTVRTPPPRAPLSPAHLPALRTQTRVCAPRAALRTYVIVAPLPEVEGPDGPEEQQHRPRNEDHSSDLEQPRGAGGLHGHRGVGLRAGGGEGRGGGTGHVCAARSPAPPVGVGNGASPFAALPPGGPFTQAWMCDKQTFGGAGPRPRGCVRRHRTPPPESRPALPCTPVWGPEPPAHAQVWAPACHIRWRRSLTPGSGFRHPRKGRVLRVD